MLDGLSVKPQKWRLEFQIPTLEVRVDRCDEETTSSLLVCQDEADGIINNRKHTTKTTDGTRKPFITTATRIARVFLSSTLRDCLASHGSR